ncbi:MAG: HPr-rel-A system PqqD family peptide chaperone [Chromatiaceae bacterium]|nr:HPr-rel-A system PqqD family peptide chaperone [Chromatiaceae bacterium]
MWHTSTASRVVRAWQDEQIVFLPRSGETHYLNPSAAAIIERLDLGPTSTECLHQSLEESRSPAPSLEEVRNILNHFKERGLVEDI